MEYLLDLDYVNPIQEIPLPLEARQISIHQSNKDVLGLTDEEERRNNLLYLSICSDLLGLISVISGYYTQENSSLLYSNLLEIIHHRTSGLKLNIQTKILHAAIR